IRNGRRESMVSAFVDPVRSRRNLTVITDALVSSVVIDDGEARGVTLERAGTRQQLRARREVIVTAGSYASPQILMLSGIGDGAALQRMRIPVKHHLPGVGVGLQAHPASVIQLKTSDPTSYGVSLRALPRGVWNILEYALW